MREEIAIVIRNDTGRTWERAKRPRAKHHRNGKVGETAKRWTEKRAKLPWLAAVPITLWIYRHQNGIKVTWEQTQHKTHENQIVVKSPNAIILLYILSLPNRFLHLSPFIRLVINIILCVLFYNDHLRWISSYILNFRVYPQLTHRLAMQLLGMPIGFMHIISQTWSWLKSNNSTILVMGNNIIL